MSGFQSPNYTQTPNDLFDELLPDMGLAELKVVMCIVRHTFGFHREEIRMSVRAIARFTGLTANSVMEGAKQAEDHGLIERHLDGNKTTLWTAVVSVVPTKTRRITKRDAGVLPAKTLLGVKESIKEIVKEKIEEEVRNPLFSFYENNIGMLSPKIADDIEASEKTYGFDWVTDAIMLAGKNGAKHFNYCATVLSRWKIEGREEKRKAGPGRKQTAAQSGDRSKYVTGDYAGYIEC